MECKRDLHNAWVALTAPSITPSTTASMAFQGFGLNDLFLWLRSIYQFGHWGFSFSSCTDLLSSWFLQNHDERLGCACSTHFCIWKSFHTLDTFVRPLLVWDCVYSYSSPDWMEDKRVDEDRRGGDPVLVEHHQLGVGAQSLLSQGGKIRQKVLVPWCHGFLNFLATGLESFQKWRHYLIFWNKQRALLYLGTISVKGQCPTGNW